MLVLVEKPSMAQHLEPILAEFFPGETFEYLIAHPYGMPFVFDYPSKLSWHDYPLWRDAAYRLDPERQRHLERDETGRLRSMPCDYANVKPHQHAIAITDPHVSAVLAGQRMRDMLQQAGKFESWLGTFTFFSLAQDDMRRQMSRPLDEEQVRWACASAQLKADFDFSFLVNSAGLLTRCYAAAGGQATSPVLSKYMIQTLYAVRMLESRKVNGVPFFLSESSLHQQMSRWEGTGRYAPERGYLGSCASRQEIIEQLQRYGLLQYHVLPGKETVTEFSRQPHRISLSALGSAFLERLHPDCEDLDLPFRIAQWQEKPFESRQAAQRYIRTWFGKQKRFMG